MTVIAGNSAGKLVVLPEQIEAPKTTTLSFGANQILSGHVATRLVSGKAKVFNSSSETVHLVVDAFAGVP